jgi:heme-degrading monooxygenase HmoA
MYYLVWEYEVSKQSQEKFEEAFTRSGGWFKFFEPCDDFLGHELIKNSENGTYLLIDKWMDKKAYDTFVKSNKSEYDSLNETSKPLYDSEKLIGTYETL